MVYPNNDPAAFMVAFYGCLLAEVVPVPIEVPLTKKVISTAKMFPAIIHQVRQDCTYSEDPIVIIIKRIVHQNNVELFVKLPEVCPPALSPQRMLVVNKLVSCWVAVELPWR